MPSKNCVVKGCKSSKEITKHRFPYKSPDDFSIWVQRTGNIELFNLTHEYMYKTYLICEQH